MFLYSQDITRNSELHQLINEYEKESTFFDKNHELPPSKRQYNYYKGLYYENNHQLDSAEYNYRKVYRPNMSFSDKDPMYRGLLSVFSKRHQADSIAKYARLYCEVNDSSIAKKDQELTAQMAASYNYSIHQKDAMESEAKANRFFLWLIVILFTFLIFGEKYLFCLIVHFSLSFFCFFRIKAHRHPHAIGKDFLMMIFG